MNNDNQSNNQILTCNSCGFNNTPQSKFCIKCGNVLQSGSISSNQNINFSTGVNNQNSDLIQNQGISSNVNQSVNNTNTEKLNYFKYILGALLKPYDQFKKDEEKLGDIKNISILSAITIGALLIVNLITSMISIVRVSSILSDKTEWVWSNLKEFSYFKYIGIFLLICIGLIVAISSIYYLGSLVVKKDTKFVKLLSATVTALLPFAISYVILAPILSLIYLPLSLCMMVIAGVYSLIILLELMNDLIPIEDKNKRIYFHLTCLSILLIVGGYISYKLILGSLTNNISGLLG